LPPAFLAALHALGRRSGGDRVGRGGIRMGQRGFTMGMINAVLAKGRRYWDPKHFTFNYILKGGFAKGNNALVGLNPVTGVVTTVISCGKIPKRLIAF
jgi:hypothetical protein